MDLTPEQEMKLRAVFQALNQVAAQVRPPEPPPPLTYDAKIVPYDPTRRRTKLERDALKVRETKRRQAQERKVHNTQVIREWNLRKDQKK